MELLALQVEAEAEAEDNSGDDATDEEDLVGAAVPRTESDLLFEQMEAKVQAEVAAERRCRSCCRHWYRTSCLSGEVDGCGNTQTLPGISCGLLQLFNKTLFWQ